MDRRNIRQPGWRGYLPRKPRQIGRRGAILLVLGICWVFLGLGILESTGSVNSGVFHEKYLPQELRGFLWISTGMIAIAHTFRPTGLSDALGFAALYLMPAQRVVSYLISWIDHLLPIWGPGMEGGWRWAALYSAILAAVIITSGWPEPARHARPGPEDELDEKAGLLPLRYEPPDEEE